MLKHAQNLVPISKYHKILVDTFLVMKGLRQASLLKAFVIGCQELIKLVIA